MQLWDEIIPQSEDTLNLLRTSRINPKLSAYASLESEFNFNTTPLAPPGTKALIFIDPTQRKTWGTYATDGWYVGPTKDQYRCYKFYVPETRGFRITQTAKIFSRHCAPPMLTRNAQILLAAESLTEALLNKPTPNILHPPNTTALQELAKIFQQNVIPNENNAEVQRVEKTTETTSHDATDKTKSQKQVHERKTRSNTPIQLNNEYTPNTPITTQTKSSRVLRTRERAPSPEPPPSEIQRTHVSTPSKTITNKASQHHPTLPRYKVPARCQTAIQRSE